MILISLILDLFEQIIFDFQAIREQKFAHLDSFYFWS